MTDLGDRNILDRNIEESAEMLRRLSALAPQVEEAARAIADRLLAGGKLLACGNGGSAADASHLTTEFVSRFSRDRRPFAAISLSSHGGDLTAIGNDYSFSEIFSRQVEAFGRSEDVLAAFTTSGKSENVRRALLAAARRGMKTIAFLGRDGGECAGLADIELLVPSRVTARIQEGHKFLLHTICELAEERLSPQA